MIERLSDITVKEYRKLMWRRFLYNLLTTLLIVSMFFIGFMAGIYYHIYITTH